MSKSFLGVENWQDLPRGIRNNNPGNLVQTDIGWKGKKTPSLDEVFETFTDISWGIRAMILDLYDDIVRDGKNTPLLLMKEYAPAGHGSNDPAGYAARVAKGLGIKTTDKIQSTSENYFKLAKVIMDVENGKGYQKYVSDDDIQVAISRISFLDKYFPRDFAPKQKNILVGVAIFVFLVFAFSTSSDES